MIGETLSHYRVLEKLGEGGMGAVYLAEDSKLKRRVALKVLPPETARDARRLQRFQREAEAIAALNHQNIVTIYSIETVAEQTVLVMELVEGQDLSQLLPPGGLELERALEVAIPVADALVAAHERGIVHRDLKPANVMIRPDGQVKVLDFGLAKFTTSCDDSERDDQASVTRTASLTREGAIMGTAPYMSPEQLQGQRVDHRSDIFSFGVVLYELVTGQRPFRGDSALDIASRILRETPPLVTELRRDLPASLGRIVATCLAKDPRERYPSVAAARDELAQLRAELRTGTAAAAPAAVASTPASSVGASAMETLVAEAPSGSSPPGARLPPAWLAVAAALLVAGVLGVWWLGRDAGSASALADVAAGEAGADAAPLDADKIAVLPFATRGTQDETGAFADGVHDDLLTTLTGIGGLKVISRTSVLQYRDTARNLREIGRELGAANLLEGSVQQVGDQVRINVQLIDARTDEHLWAKTYDRELSAANLFDIQSEIAQTIAQALSVTLSTEERDRIAREPTDDLEAFYAYNRGKQLFVHSTFDSLRAARGELEQALALDPDYVLANVTLAATHLMLANTGEKTLEEALREGRPYVDRAIALDPGNAYALAMLGRYQFAAGEPGHEETFERALERGPNVVEVLNHYATYLSARQRYDDAIATLRRALELDPLSAALYHDLGRSQISLGRFDEARAAFRRIAQIDPQNPYAAHGSGLATILGGRLAEAAYWSDRASDFDPADYENQSTSALIYGSLGDFDMARQRVQEALALGPREPYPLSAQAYLLTVAGDREAAVRVARAALAQRLDDRWRSDFVFLRVLRDEALATGETEEALAWYRQLTPELLTDEPAVDPNNVQKAVDLAHLLQRRSDRGAGDEQQAEQAQKILRAVIDVYDQNYAVGAANFPLGIAKAEALALLGRTSEALDALQRFYDDGWRLMWRWDTVLNRNLDSLRNEPHLAKLVEAIETDLEAQREAFAADPPAATSP